MKNTRRERWGAVVLWTALIYATVPIGRPICDFLIRKTSFSFFMNAAVLIVLSGLCFYFIRMIRIRRPSSYLILGMTCLAYIAGLKIFTIPAEKIHFLEYGLLAFLIFRAVSFDWAEGRAYGPALIMTAVIGWGDEGLQSITPGRYYQTMDVVLNALSGGLGLLLTYVARREGNSSC